MKKNIYKLDNIDCAACANKIEDGVNNLEGVFSSNINFITLNFIVSFDETIINDEEIENCIRKSLRGVKIIKKNNEDFVDTYEEQNGWKKILFKKFKK